jgi:hypothetical protein
MAQKKAASSRRSGSGSRARATRPKDGAAKLVSKAKLPLLAGGAAAAGLASGVAIGAKRAQRRSHLSLSSRDLAKAARQVGVFGTQVGQVASELQRAREAANDGQHRSPIEIVLEGLTARRARA